MGVQTTHTLAKSEVASSFKLLYLSASQTLLAPTKIGKEHTFLSGQHHLVLSIVCLSHRDDVTASATQVLTQ